MKHSDEIALMRATVADLERWPDGVLPVGMEPPWHRIGMNPKRAAFIYRKWMARGWCEFGTELRPIWPDSGRALLAALAELAPAGA